jgi:hypothetical protein
MSIPAWIASDPATLEAYQHGRTQERLRQAVEALREIRELCRGPIRMRSDPRPKYRLLEIEVTAAVALERLSASTGGVIDAVSLLAPEPPCR